MKRAIIISASVLIPRSNRLGYAGDEVSQEDFGTDFDLRIKDGHLKLMESEKEEPAPAPAKNQAKNQSKKQAEEESPFIDGTERAKLDFEAEL